MTRVQPAKLICRQLYEKFETKPKELFFFHSMPQITQVVIKTYVKTKECHKILGIFLADEKLLECIQMPRRPWKEHMCNEEVLRQMETKKTVFLSRKDTVEITKMHNEESGFAEFDAQSGH